MAEPLDEAAVTRKARVGDDDVIDRALLGAGTGERITTDMEFSFEYLFESVVGFG
jgi:hypothetical protein